MGGLTYSFWSRSEVGRDDNLKRVHCFRQDIDDPSLRVVVLIPKNTMSTRAARLQLEGRTYPTAHAVFNLSRSTCLPAIFREKRYELLHEAMKDRIHQEARMDLYEGFKNPVPVQDVLDAAVHAGAYSACIAGAGSSLVAFSSEANASDVRTAFSEAFNNAGEGKWTVKDAKVLRPRNEGCTVESSEVAEQFPTQVAMWLENAVVVGRPELREPILFGPGIGRGSQLAAGGSLEGWFKIARDRVEDLDVDLQDRIRTRASQPSTPTGLEVSERLHAMEEQIEWLRAEFAALHSGGGGRRARLEQAWHHLNKIGREIRAHMWHDIFAPP
jgi:hypothetical protein